MGDKDAWRIEAGRSSPLTLLALSFAVMLAVVGVLLVFRLATRPEAPQSLVPVPPVSPVAESFQVYFTNPNQPETLSDHAGRLDEHLAGLIDSARVSVDVTIRDIGLDNITEALVNAQSRGVVVRTVADVNSQSDPRQIGHYSRLRAAGIPLVVGNPTGTMHHKFVVIDGETVWTGSWNFTEGDTFRHNNNAIVVHSTELARNYTAAFQKMWRDKQFGADRQPGGTTSDLYVNGMRVQNYFAPEDMVASRIASRLAEAQVSIDFLAFTFTDETIGEVVRERARAGVRVRGVFDSGSIGPTSEYRKMKGENLDVHQDGNPSTMHHKVFIIDGQTVEVGSYNFTHSANTENDENMLIIDDPALAGQFTAEFERVYGQAKP